ncbi:uncharacterized protein BO80DRAFT_466024 [Aspergillus ibericus CBS 121593]|uniref:Aminoglycoside phosphotransferase domain-containing protein n=1 Tax=Aspergillus ibericus CBS 121593 TaxID=1448316 RepID=A0A395GWA5_9EURO|nr:hypothetical protein BO80DRAFT_466024 [Aspergillus ibericus CBS 121593]RAK99712.1 hypothetical protein BO80DRAFT_466024 [Aspergillus ibericus CBS 121593]
MSRTRRLLRREITYSFAKEEEVNILHQLSYYDKQNRFFSHLNHHQRWIKNIVAHHLNLSSPDACHVSNVESWLHGSFNVCIPVTVCTRSAKQVILRLPLPYRVGEEFMPGNGDEKVRCEAGTYAWLQENCPDVPIPGLYGFGLSTGETFTCLENLPLLYKWFHSIRRRVFAWLGYPTPSRYVPHPPKREQGVHFNYLLLEYIEPSRGSMLSDTWTDHQHDIRLRTNLFHGLARILLSISRIPIPRIGSFLIDHKGFLILANRPLSIGIQQLENGHIPTGMHRDCTYSTVDSYVADVLTFHDNRFRYQPNAVNDLGDCVFQLSSLSAMRTISKTFFQRELRRGPFVFSLTDMHQSNIFVDADWNITCLVDLEWACSLPIEMIRPPHWLTSMGVDELVLSEYDKLRTEFMDALNAEEQEMAEKPNSPLLSDVMSKTWATGTFWYTLALSSPSGLFTIFKQHIRPLFCTEYIEEFNLIMPFLWDRNVGRIASHKLSDKKEYDRQLQQEFGVESPV